jgi:hypothetical protein
LIQINAPARPARQAGGASTERQMTTYQCYFLIMVLAVFFGFGVAVAANTISYHRWLRRQRPGGGL